MESWASNASIIAFVGSVFRSGEFANCSSVLLAAYGRGRSDSGSLPLMT